MMIDALPAEFRKSILGAAMVSAPNCDFSTSYLVGIYRSRLFDCIAEFCNRPMTLMTVNQLLSGSCCAEYWSRFAAASNAAEVQLVLCDLLEHIKDVTEKHEHGC